MSDEGRLRKYVLDHGLGATSIVVVAIGFKALPHTTKGAFWREEPFDHVAFAAMHPELVERIRTSGFAIVSPAP